jgi:hypothetical protein
MNSSEFTQLMGSPIDPSTVIKPRSSNSFVLIGSAVILGLTMYGLYKWAKNKNAYESNN